MSFGRNGQEHPAAIAARFLCGASCQRCHFSLFPLSTTPILFLFFSFNSIEPDAVPDFYFLFLFLYFFYGGGSASHQVDRLSALLIPRRLESESFSPLDWFVIYNSGHEMMSSHFQLGPPPVSLIEIDFFSPHFLIFVPRSMETM